MNYRYLRIAFSAVCGVLCLLLIVLWVRSYWWEDHAIKPITPPRAIVFSSYKGQFQVRITSLRPGAYIRQGNTVVPIRASEWQLGSEGASGRTSIYRLGFGLRPSFYIGAPQWILVLAYVALAVSPWIKWSKRFSLRTLLIATTLVAVALGLIVALR